MEMIWRRCCQVTPPPPTSSDGIQYLGRVARGSKSIILITITIQGIKKCVIAQLIGARQVPLEPDKNPGASDALEPLFTAASPGSTGAAPGSTYIPKSWSYWSWPGLPDIWLVWFGLVVSDQFWRVKNSIKLSNLNVGLDWSGYLWPPWLLDHLMVIITAVL